MRPIYVTPHDEAVQTAGVTAFIDYLRTKGGIYYVSGPQPELSRIDWKLYHRCDSTLAALAEVKGRKKPSGRMYDTWFLENAKVQAAFAESARLMVSFYLIFLWDDDGYFAPVRPQDCCGVWTGGNYQRNDGMGDIAPMAHFPAHIFTYMGKVKLPGISPPPHPPAG